MCVCVRERERERERERVLIKLMTCKSDRHNLALTESYWEFAR